MQTTGLVAQIEVFESAKRQGSKAFTANTGLFHQTMSRMHSGPLVIDNQTVVLWVRSGRSSDYITASIKHAPGTRFDLSEAEVLKLRREGVNKRVLKAMAKSQPGYHQAALARRTAVITAVSLLWWLPLVLR